MNFVKWKSDKNQFTPKRNLVQIYVPRDSPVTFLSYTEKIYASESFDNQHFPMEKARYISIRLNLIHDFWPRATLKGPKRSFVVVLVVVVVGVETFWIPAKKVDIYCTASIAVCPRNYWNSACPWNCWNSVCPWN